MNQKAHSFIKGDTPLQSQTMHVFNPRHSIPSHGGSEKPGKLELGRASRDSTGLGALEEGLISS